MISETVGPCLPNHKIIVRQKKHVMFAFFMNRFASHSKKNMKNKAVSIVFLIGKSGPTRRTLWVRIDHGLLNKNKNNMALVQLLWGILRGSQRRPNRLLNWFVCFLSMGRSWTVCSQDPEVDGETKMSKKNICRTTAWCSALPLRVCSTCAGWIRRIGRKQSWSLMREWAVNCPSCQLVKTVFYTHMRAGPGHHFDLKFQVLRQLNAIQYG